MLIKNAEGYLLLGPHQGHEFAARRGDIRTSRQRGGVGNCIGTWSGHVKVTLDSEPRTSGKKDVDCIIATNKCHYEMLSSWATLEVTSEDERLSSSTCFSTPRSANNHQHSHQHAGAEGHGNAPKRANTRAGVPVASLISMGRSGLCFLMTGYSDTTNWL